MNAARNLGLLAIAGVLCGLGLRQGLSQRGDDPEWISGPLVAQMGQDVPLGGQPVGSGGPLLQAPTPDVAVIDDLAFHYGPVLFDHGLHVEMCEVKGECANCHHETPAGAPITGCRECHPISRSYDELRRPGLKGAFHRQCMDCHREWSHENACGFCHEEAGAQAPVYGAAELGELVGGRATHISPQESYAYHTGLEGTPVVSFHHDQHVQAFGLSCADCHQEDSCQRCHGGGEPRRVIEREQSCMSCHSASTCVTCHSPLEKPPFGHDSSTGWALSESHAALDCAECHGPSRGAALVAPSPLRCRGCHESAHGGGVEQLAGEVPLLGSHASFECVWCHDGTEGGLGVSCTRCHEADRYPADLPGIVGAGPLSAGSGAR